MLLRILGAVRASTRGVQTGGVLSVKLIRLNFKGPLILFHVCLDLHLYV